jgi:hypothetical protein
MKRVMAAAELQHGSGCVVQQLQVTAHFVMPCMGLIWHGSRSGIDIYHQDGRSHTAATCSWRPALLVN